MYCPTNNTGWHEEEYSLVDNVILFQRHQSLYRYSSLQSVSGYYATMLVCCCVKTSAPTKWGLLPDHWIAKLWQCDYSVVRPSFGVQICMRFNADHFTEKVRVHARTCTHTPTQPCLYNDPVLLIWTEHPNPSWRSFVCVLCVFVCVLTADVEALI